MKPTNVPTAATPTSRRSHASRAGIADGPGEGGQTDDYEGCAGGVPWAFTDHEDERRDSQDRSAAAGYDIGDVQKMFLKLA